MGSIIGLIIGIITVTLVLTIKDFGFTGRSKGKLLVAAIGITGGALLASVTFSFYVSLLVAPVMIAAVYVLFFRDTEDDEVWGEEEGDVYTIEEAPSPQSSVEVEEKTQPLNNRAFVEAKERESRSETPAREEEQAENTEVINELDLEEELLAARDKQKVYERPSVTEDTERMRAHRSLEETFELEDIKPYYQKEEESR